MKCTSQIKTILLAAFLGFLPVFTISAQDETAKDAGGTSGQSVDGDAANILSPANWDDRAFDQFVDLDLLTLAIAKQDAGLLADVAFQFAGGERTLHRSHRAVSADQLLEMAAKLAAEKQDKGTLKRLAAAAEATGSKKLGTMVANLEKFSGASRATEPAVMIDAGKVPVEAVREYQGLLRSIATAKTIGSRSALQEMEEELELNTIGLTEDQKSAVAKKLKEAIDSTPKHNAAADALAQLSGVSRGGLGLQLGNIRLNLGNSGQSFGQQNQMGQQNLFGQPNQMGQQNQFSGRPPRGSSMPPRGSSFNSVHGRWVAYINGQPYAQLTISPSGYTYHDNGGSGHAPHSEHGRWQESGGTIALEEHGGMVDHYSISVSQGQMIWNANGNSYLDRHYDWRR